jgi:hypothetical protein
MFFTLKKAIMERAIAKRNAQKPFDFAGAEAYTLAGVTDPLINNSYYFSGHSESMSVFCRLGRRVNKDETWFAVYYKGKMYSLKQETFAPGQSPLTIQGLHITFRGTLNDTDEATFEATFHPGQSPIDFTSNMPAVRMATGVANEKWSRELFQNLQNISGQTHYEQEGTLTGTLTLGGQEIQVELPCVRDHSFGKRDWSYMNNHLWLMAVAPECQFNYSLVSYPVMSVLEVGNYRSSGKTNYLIKANLNLETVAQGTVPETLELEVTLDNGQTVNVQAHYIAGVTYHFPGYILHENIAEFTLDGNTCRGILEIGFNEDASRIFNQRDLTTIKR